MALDSVVRSGVKTAHKVTKSLQEDVKHEAWVYETQFGEKKYDSPVWRKALVEQDLHTHRLSDGRFVEVQAKLTFLDEVPGNGAEGRVEPIDSRDRLTLKDGTTGPIVDVRGLRDPGKERPYYLDVYMGAS